jgi:4-diphosphocytidyl-2-C-methyl-D-erythritol kinase
MQDEVKLLRAPAKVNVNLRVGKLTKNGKHKIKTIMILYPSLYDEIQIRPNAGPEIVYEGEGTEIEALNVDSNVHALMAALEKRENVKIKVSIRIIKNIPIGSGLGGSASDAGVILKFFGQVFDYSHHTISEIANEIGSDVAFFALGYKAAIIQGTGEKVRSLPYYKQEVKQIFNFPKIISSTKEVYAEFDKNDKYKINYFSKYKNDLMPAFFRKHPTMVGIYQKMKKDKPEVIKGKLIMAGSGSSFA